MSSSVAPLFPKTSVFIPAYWASVRSEILTLEEADARYLKFPVGQGTESIPNLIVAGSSTLGITSTSQITNTGNINSAGYIGSNEEIICSNPTTGDNIDIFPYGISGSVAGASSMNLSMYDGFNFYNSTQQRGILTDPTNGITQWYNYVGFSATIPLLTMGIETGQNTTAIIKLEASDVGTPNTLLLNCFNADDQYSSLTLTSGDDLGTSPIATIGINDPTFGSISNITIENQSIAFFVNNISLLSLGSNCLFNEPIRFGTDCGVLEQSVINTTTTGTTNLVFNSTNAYRTIINTPTSGTRVFVLQAPVGQQIGGWFKICNKSTAFTIAVQQPLGTTIFTIPVSPTGGAGSVAKFAIDSAGTAYFRAG
jgi:hypothetical protein